MRNMKWTAAMIIGSGLALASFAADAQDANSATCIQKSEQVKTALNENQNSSNYEAAVAERRYGDEWCGGGLFQRGIAHYDQALSLLGAK